MCVLCLLVYFAPCSQRYPSPLQFYLGVSTNGPQNRLPWIEGLSLKPRHPCELTHIRILSVKGLARGVCSEGVPRTKTNPVRPKNKRDKMANSQCNSTENGRFVPRTGPVCPKCGSRLSLTPSRPRCLHLLVFFLPEEIGFSCRQTIGVQKLWVQKSEIGEECRQFWACIFGLNFFGGVGA